MHRVGHDHGLLSGDGRCPGREKRSAYNGPREVGQAPPDAIGLQRPERVAGQCERHSLGASSHLRKLRVCFHCRPWRGYDERMPNYRRAYVPGGSFFFTLVTHRRAPLFAEARGRTLLGSMFRRCLLKWPFTLQLARIVAGTPARNLVATGRRCRVPEALGLDQEGIHERMAGGPGGGEERVSDARKRRTKARKAARHLAAALLGAHAGG